MFEESVSRCAINVTWFPFDDQLCHFIFESWKYNASQLNVSSAPMPKANYSYHESEQWQLLGTSSSYYYYLSSNSTLLVTSRRDTTRTSVSSTHESYSFTSNEINTSESTPSSGVVNAADSAHRIWRHTTIC